MYLCICVHCVLYVSAIRSMHVHGTRSLRFAYLPTVKNSSTTRSYIVFLFLIASLFVDLFYRRNAENSAMADITESSSSDGSPASVVPSGTSKNSEANILS